MRSVGIRGLLLRGRLCEGRASVVHSLEPVSAAACDTRVAAHTAFTAEAWERLFASVTVFNAALQTDPYDILGSVDDSVGLCAAGTCSNLA